MESKSLLVGIVIGIVIGGIIGIAVAPHPDVEGLEEAVDALELQISTLQASLQTKDSEIASLNAEVSQLESQVAPLASMKTDFYLVDVSFSRVEDTSSVLQHWIGAANETIRLMVMLITQDELADALIEAHNRGVDIDIIIDDDWYYSTGSDYERTFNAGIDVRGDERGGLMHHKVMIIDDHIVVTGSYNWSASAEDKNDENIVIIDSHTLATIYMQEFTRLRAQT